MNCYLWAQVWMNQYMAIICNHEDIAIHSHLQRKSGTSAFLNHHSTIRFSVLCLCNDFQYTFDRSIYFSYQNVCTALATCSTHCVHFII